MARELSQEEVLDFLCRTGGQATNAALLGHFKRFLRDPALPPELRLQHRECFKRYVNSVAVVREEAPPGCAPTKVVVLRARYRDLLGEEELPTAEGCLPHQEEGWRQESGPATHRESITELPRTFSAVCGSQDSKSHTCLGGQQSHPGGLHWSLKEAAVEEQSRTIGSPRRADGYPQGERASSQAPPVCLALSPHSKDTLPPCSLYTGKTSQQQPPSSATTSLLSSSSPVRTVHPNLALSNGTYPPHTRTIGSTSSQFSQSQGTALPCPPLSRGTPPPCSFPVIAISTPHPQSSQGTSEPCNASLRDTVPPCHPSSGDISSRWPPVSVDTDPSFPLSGSVYHMHPTSSSFHPSSRSVTSKRPTSLEFRPPLPSPSSISASLPGTVLDMFAPTREDEWPPVDPPPFLESLPMLPGEGLESGWWGHLPVFKSIRCQLSLQDLNDFVDQATNDSEESGSSSDSDSSTIDMHERVTFVASTAGECFESCRGASKSIKCMDMHSSIPSAQFNQNGVQNRLSKYETAIESSEASGRTPQVISKKSDIQLDVLPFVHEGQRLRKSLHLQDKMSSSDDKLINLHCKKKSRPVSHHKKASKLPLFAPAPGVDLSLIVPLVDVKHFSTDSCLTPPKQVLRLGIYSGLVGSDAKRISCHRSSVVPLDTKEHEWVVKLASGSWMQVYGLFNENPYLALHRDFISGYTALHWIAKHGNYRMFLNFVSGAEKAGIKLDVDAKSNGGYTPLHLAAIHGHENVIKLLVEKMKVKVTARDHSGKRAWQYLCSSTTGEVWHLLGAPKGKTIFPVCTLPTVAPPVKNTRSRAAVTNLSRKSSLAAFLKPQHLKWKSNQSHLSAHKEAHSD
ncbi:hypothetical protein NDU88_000425 [Pleurodeles waltl]|uniref:SOWAHA-C winged helix-turn-helix domain-containing protein n=1 Tax=Pleurodeles waltl TaxID=8319 RepID=A0AAV7VY42_PLEWA|nr:hypothetical protein NDU88_000425 [Pleurodeles waltl]